MPRTPWHKKKFSKAHALVHIPYKESHRQSANKALTQKKIKKSSKVNALVHIPYKATIETAFENTHTREDEDTGLRTRERDHQGPEVRNSVKRDLLLPQKRPNTTTQTGPGTRAPVHGGTEIF